MLACARTRVDRDTRARISQLAGNVDAARFLKCASAHQVLPLVAASLLECDVDLPWFQAGNPRHLLRESALSGMAAAGELVAVARLLSEHAIPAIAYKGPVLCAVAYGGAFIRQFADLDIWVDPYDYHLSVPHLLHRAGWRATDDFGFERTYVHAESGTVLDVHRSLTHPHRTPFGFDFAVAHGRSMVVDLGAGPVETLSVPDLLVVLCVQLVKDAGEGALPLIKVCDIAELVGSAPDLEWSLIISRARSLGVLRILCLGLALANRLLDLPVPRELEPSTRHTPSFDSLVRHLEQRILGEEDQPYSRPELLKYGAWNTATRERYRDRNALMIALRVALAPSAGDYESLRLPRALAPFYGVVRPARVLTSYASKVVGRWRGAGA